MKLPKKKPEAAVRVYPAGKDTFKMILMVPKEVATLRTEGTKWITEDGQQHRTHRDAMRHVARLLKDRDLMRAVPGNVKSPQKKQQDLHFKSPEDVLRFAVQQEGFAGFLLRALDDYTKPVKDALNDREIPSQAL